MGPEGTLIPSCHPNREETDMKGVNYLWTLLMIGFLLLPAYAGLTLALG